ncbi:MAG TPA: ribonuclease H family protein [Desulfitobacteriaceae bacterium]|nr:ribonuclease H family protein [Desulfitobacteriaceae bacterium]
MPKKAKYYAIRAGRKIGIVRTWEACRQSVEGYPGAVYKSFSDEQIALDWLQGSNSACLPGAASLKVDNNINIRSRDQEQLADTSFADADKDIDIDIDIDYEVYTDGSYVNGNYAWAYVFVKNDQIVYEDSGIGKNLEAAAMRNVTGEIAAVLYAVKHAAGLKARIRINHDYAGIACWVNGKWQTKNVYTELYVKLMRKYEGLYVFRKVQAHSGNKYNEYVDKLAKAALVGT